VPVLSLSIDFYVRLFVRVFDSPSQVKCAYIHCAILQAFCLHDTLRHSIRSISSCTYQCSECESVLLR
jgi:tRNA G26 N,N-dimethylase Trm1